MDHYANGAPVFEISQGQRKAHDNRALGFLTRLQFVLGSESRLRIRLQRRKRLIVTIEIDGRDRFAAQFTSRSYNLTLDVMYPKRLLASIFQSKSESSKNGVLIRQIHCRNVVQ